MRIFAVFSRPPAALAAAIVIAAVATAPARASTLYAYAEQSISNVSISVASGSLTVSGPATYGVTDSATLGGIGPAGSGTTSVPQAYTGTPSPPPDNTFSMFATFPSGPPIPAGTLPTSPSDSFGRGDADIPTANSASAVGETLVVGTGQGSGDGTFTGAVSFTPTADTTLTLSYHYANDIYTVTGGPGTAQANYKFDATISSDTNPSVFNSAPGVVNLSLSAPPNGNELIRSGDITVTTGLLTAGTVYTLTFSGGAHAFANTSAVPEPGSLSLAGVAVGLAGLAGLRRKRSAA